MHAEMERERIFLEIVILRRVWRDNQRKLSRDQPWEWPEVGEETLQAERQDLERETYWIELQGLKWWGFGQH